MGLAGNFTCKSIVGIACQALHPAGATPILSPRGISGASPAIAKRGLPANSPKATTFTDDMWQMGRYLDDDGPGARDDALGFDFIDVVADHVTQEPGTPSRTRGAAGRRQNSKDVCTTDEVPGWSQDSMLCAPLPSRPRTVGGEGFGGVHGLFSSTFEGASAGREASDRLGSRGVTRGVHEEPARHGHASAAMTDAMTHRPHTSGGRLTGGLQPQLVVRQSYVMKNYVPSQRHVVETGERAWCALLTCRRPVC